MIVVVFKYLIPKGYRGLTLYPFVIISNDKDRGDATFLNHEKIHIRQQLEMLVLPFYIWYVIEYLFRLIQYKDRRKAYMNISFEREAYANEKDLNYIRKRAFWIFLKYC
jgi:hypothetical protein